MAVARDSTMPRMRDRLAAGILVVAFAACGGQPSNERAEFVGRRVCARCHAEQERAWRGSHHDLAMQEATAETVLGDFDDARFEHRGEVTTFYREGDRFLVRAVGADGRRHDYEVAYTFGVEPLQQYLVRLPGGRLQALTVCWDSRPRAQGGQRWFSLYPEETIRPGDPLHWTSRNFTWNSMCARCHSTDVHKGYDEATDTFRTTFAEIDVSCEACHGPGGRHVAWAEAGASPDRPGRGLVVRFGEPHTWSLAPGATTARREPAAKSRSEVETCGACHARRTECSEAPWHGRPLLDTHRVALLEDPLYFADGQIREEVYVYGSFLQSRMHAQGVTCSDCHRPHSLRLRAEGNALCTRCHRPEIYDTSAHHRHAPASEGAACVACHMPQRRYMVIDDRADHSIRVPRPDLSVALGTPNACNSCHADRDARWAAAAIAAARRDSGPRRAPHWAHAFDSARRGTARAPELLRSAADTAEWPAIVRATALALLARHPDPETFETARRALAAKDPLLRFGAVQALEYAPESVRVPALAPRLADPVRVVRLEAARILAGVSEDRLPPAQRARLASALAEYEAFLGLHAERAWAHVNLALLHERRGDHARAEREYRAAIAREASVRAYVNLADLYRARGRDDLGEKVLREGLARCHEKAELHHALGLLLARVRRRDEALVMLERAAVERPEEPRFAYAYGVALHSTGQVERALAVLERAYRRHPRDRDLLVALATFHAEAGRREAARRYARRLVEAFPKDPGARELMRRLAGR